MVVIIEKTESVKKLFKGEIMKSNSFIRIEFMPGTEIKDAIFEAKTKAEKFDVKFICFDFNGIKFSIGRYCNIDEAVDIYNSNPKSKHVVLN